MNNLQCPMCGYRFFRFSFPWHLYHAHRISIPTPAGGWRQESADALNSRRWQ
jgi:hypothetical protein